MKILSWNVNSLKKKSIKEYLENSKDLKDPDIICIQETKCTEKDFNLHNDQDLIEEYPYRYWNDAVKGRAGVCVFSKIELEPIKEPTPLISGINDGRILCLKFKNKSKSIILINMYVPNTGTGAKAEKIRTLWHRSLLSFLKQNTKNKTKIIIAGDLNVVDNPSLDTSIHTKRSKTVGGLKEFEYEEFQELLNVSGLKDAFRTKYPQKQSFTWFSSRHKQSKMRLDYILTNLKRYSIEHGPFINSKLSDHAWILFTI